MDHYVPKRRIPVTLWSSVLQGVAGQLFLDLDPSGNRHQTVLDKLNESAPFLPVALGEEGRIHLYNKSRLTRVALGKAVQVADIYARGFQPWREEETDVLLADGTRLAGRMWMPLQRESQRASDFMNQQGSRFFVLHSSTGTHLISASAVTEVRLSESMGAPIGSIDTPVASDF
jgi:hypothetical protein